MPTRDEMIQQIVNADRASVPARAGSVAQPSREDMIKAIVSGGLPDESYKSGLEKSIDQGVTAARSGLEGLTLGLSEPVISGTNATIGAAMDAESVGDFFDKIPEKYRADVSERREMKARYPKTDIGFNIAGALLPAVATFGSSSAASATAAARAAKVLDMGGTVARGTTGLAKAAIGAERARALADSTSLAARAGRVALAAGEGAASAGVSEGVRQGVLKTSGHMKSGEGPSIGEAALLGAKFGGGLSGAVEGMGAAAKAAPWAAKKAMTVALGPSGEAIESYLKDSQRINNAKSVEEIKTGLDQTVQKLSDDVASAKISEQEAKDVFKQLEADHRVAKAEAGIDYERMAHGFREQFRDAKQKLDDSFRFAKEQLQSRKAPIHMAGDVSAAVGDLKQQVIRGSNEAYEILERTPGKVNLQKPFRMLAPLKESLSIAGAGAITPQAKAAVSEIDGLVNSIGQLPVTMSYPEAKKLIQQLDAAEKHIQRSGEFTDEVGRAYAALRRGVDEQLKQIPAYAEKMHDVAKKTRLLSNAADRFGDNQTTISRLNSIGRETSGPDRELLGELGKLTGKNFISDVDGFVAAQKTLSNPEAMRKIQRELPEYKQSRVTSIANERLKNPDTRIDFIKTRMGRTGIQNQMDQAQGSLDSARAKVSATESELAPFKTITPLTSQSKIQSVMRDSKTQNIETRNMLDKLGQKSGQNFLDEIDARRIADQFSRTNMNGSRNTVAYGTILGFLTGGWGAPVGAAMGLAIDKFGPQIAKKMLDQAIKIKGNPTVQKIQELDLPPEVKSFLAQAMTKESVESARNSAINVADSRERLKGREKWASDGAEKLRKHGININASTADPKMKDLLIRASDLSPNSKAMQNVVTQINRLKKGGE